MCFESAPSLQLQEAKGNRVCIFVLERPITPAKTRSSTALATSSSKSTFLDLSVDKLRERMSFEYGPSALPAREQVRVDCYLSPTGGTAPTGNGGPFSIDAVFAQIVHSPGEARNKIPSHLRQCAS